MDPLRLASAGLGAARATAAVIADDLLHGPGNDPLDERDPDHIRATLPAYRVMSDLYFRTKVRGLEHIPAEGPVLLVGNHSGGTLIADTFAFSYAFIEHFGADRLFHQLAHDLVFKVPGVRTIRKYGTVPASHEHAERALQRGAALLVYPGGDHESYRPSWEGNRVDFAGRSGFVQLALNQDVPIVPVVAIGGQETALFLWRGRRASRVLGVDRLLRLKVLPMQVAPPFGLTLLDLPLRVPLPSQLTIQVLPPIHLREELGPEPDREEAYEAITGEMQAALDELAAERDVPVVGAVRPRADGSAVADALARERSA